MGSRAEGLALVLFTGCSWGLTWPMAKYALTQLPPFAMRSAAGVVGIAFAFLVAALRREHLRVPQGQWAWLTVYALLNYGLFIVLTTQALVWLKASEAVIVTYTLPIWASVLAWPMLGERPSWRKAAALVLGVGGVAMLVGIGTVDASWDKLPGFLVCLLAAWLFGLGTVIAKRHPLRLPPTTSVAWQLAIGHVPIFALAFTEHPAWANVTAGGWAVSLYIGTIPLTVAYLAWYRALRLIPASVAAMTVLLSPMVGVIGSTLMLAETLGPRQLIALAMTLSGVALAARG